MIDMVLLMAGFEKKCRAQPIDVHFTQEDFDRHMKDMERRHNEMIAKSLEKHDHQSLPKT